MSLTFDDQRQPPPVVNRWHRTDRSVHELVGLARGLLADGQLCCAEVNNLVSWLEANPDVTTVFPGNVLAARLASICDDGRVDADEIRNFQIVLQQMAGGILQTGMILSATLPLNEPQPTLKYDSRLFVLTGHFAFGPRRICEDAIVSQGGRCASAVTKQTHYLVVGTFSSRDWTQSSYGRKIEKAVRLRSTGYPVAIISEDHWADSLETKMIPHAEPMPDTRLLEVLRRTMADGEIDGEEMDEVLTLLFSFPESFDHLPRLKQLLLELSADGKCTEDERIQFERYLEALLPERTA